MAKFEVRIEAVGTMNRCNAIRDILLDYCEEELSDQGRRRVEAHLAECSGCAGELARLRAIRDRVESLPVPEPSAESWDAFGESVRRRIALLPPPRPSLGRRLLDWLREAQFLQPVPALGAAVALGLLLAVGLVHTPRPVERTPADIVAAGEAVGIGMDLDVLRDLDLLELLGDIDLFESLPTLAQCGDGLSAWMG